MRYYDIFIDGAPSVFRRLPNGAIWSSHPFGDSRADPGAQQVEFQFITQSPSRLISDGSTLTVHGVSWEQIGQSASLVGLPIKVMGGMKPGLPLAKHQAQHAGLLISGQIYKCWGNWIGTEMTVGMTIVNAGAKAADDSAQAPDQTTTEAPAQSPAASANSTSMREVNAIHYNRTGPRSIDRRPFPRAPSAVPFGATPIPGGAGNFGGEGSLVGVDFGNATQTIGGVISSLFGGAGGLVNPLNFIHDLQPNMPLSSAIQQTLSKVFPNAKLNINISPKLKLGYQDAGIYQSFTQYASFIKDLSHSILGTKGYLGINMTTKGNTINVWDGTGSSATAAVSVLDLIGQPTWVDVGLIHIPMVLRGDLEEPNIITLPHNILIGIEGSSQYALLGSEQRQKLSFTGSFRILTIQHIGDFRNPDGVQWSSNYTCQNVSGDEIAQQEAAQAAQNLAQAPPAQQLAGGIAPLSAPQQMPQVASRLLTRPVRRY